MSIKESQKFTPEELEKVQDLQLKIQKITTQMGQLYMTKIRIEDQEKVLRAQLNSIEEEERNIAKDLTNKYGKGSLNTDSGEFTPTK